MPIRPAAAPAALLVAALAFASPPTDGARTATDARPTRGATPRTTVTDAARRAQPRARDVRPVAQPAPPHRARHLRVFGGLGAWVDMYDYPALNATRTARMLAAAGVRTMYVQTGWPSTTYAVAPAAGRWLEAGHRAGLKVVGWYLPHYADVRRDVARTVAIARYRRNGHRFDGLGIDVEFRSAVNGHWRWMHNVARHARAVRAKLPRYPVATIPPTPLQMEVAPGYWKGFPWRAIASGADVVMLMSYWSDRSGCPEVRRHCAYEYTAMNVRRTRELSGIPRMPVHIIGGVGDRISHRELKDFVRGAIDAGADGASIYDVATTPPGWWRTLARLRGLGDQTLRAVKASLAKDRGSVHPGRGRARGR